MPRRPCAGAFSIDRPSRTMRPPLGRRLPANRLNIVVLPAPLGPMRPAISPRATDSDTPSTALIPPKCLDTEWASSMPTLTARRDGPIAALRCLLCGQPCYDDDSFATTAVQVISGQQDVSLSGRQFRALRSQGRSQSAGGCNDLLRRAAGRLFRAARRDAAPAPGSGLLHLFAGGAPAAPARQAAHDRSQRLDVDRRRGGLSRSQLSDAVSHHAHGQAPVLASSSDGRTALPKS